MKLQRLLNIGLLFTLITGCHDVRVVAVEPEVSEVLDATAEDAASPDAVTTDVVELACEECEDGQVCEDGQCVCREGLSPCDGDCDDLQTDRENCGACGVNCEVSCFEGSCVEQTCEELDASLVGCGERGGSCVSLESLERDPLHCGECDASCSADEICVDGDCVTSE